MECDYNKVIVRFTGVKGFNYIYYEVLRISGFFACDRILSYARSAHDPRPLSRWIRCPMILLQTQIGIIVSDLNPVYGRITFYLNPPYIGHSMLRKNHIARILVVILAISVMVSMAGVVGAFEIKINTVQHSMPVNGEIPANYSPPVVTPSVTPTQAVINPDNPTPDLTPVQSPTPDETIASPGNGNATSSSGPVQDNFWSFVNSLFNSSPGEPGPEALPTTEATTVPTTQATPVPTTIPTTVPTTQATPVPTTEVTTVPTTQATPLPTTEPIAEPWTIATTVPTTQATPVPTTIPKTVTTTQATPVPTTIPTIVPTTQVTPVLTTIPTTVPTTQVTPVPTPTPAFNHEVRGNGTICLVPVEGGFFGIVSDDGSHYIPGKVDPLFQVDGLRVTYRALERHDRIDSHNWGTPVDLMELVQVGRVIEQRIDGKGTIHYEALEGGFFGINADNGGKYLPVHLDDTFKTDGLRVNFSAYPASVSTISMWGTPVRLVTIVQTDPIQSRSQGIQARPPYVSG